MTFTSIESRVLAWIAERSQSAALKEQLRIVIPLARDYTGAGSYTTLEVPPTVPAAQIKRGPVDGPWFRSPAMEGAACSLLWLKNGRVSCLELAGFRTAEEAEGAEFLPE